MSDLLVDDRFNNGGIQRFYRELVARIDSRLSISKVSEVYGGFALGDPLSPIRLSSAIRRQRPAVFWSPGFMPPYRSPVPFLFTIHDLMHARSVRGIRSIYFNTILRHLSQSAYKVITVSDFARNEICEWAELPLDRVVTIYNGVSNCFTPEGARHSSDRPYLLFVGAHRTNKNLPGMLLAFARSGLAGKCKFLLTGSPNSELRNLIQQLGIEKSLEFLGFVGDDQLPAYYRGALGLVLLSTEEGFGIPPLEAMACGTPVLCSNTTSLPEVVGEAALQTAPDQIDGMAEAMARIVHDSALREELVLRGLQRCTQFRWERSAEKLCGLFMEAIASGPTVR